MLSITSPDGRWLIDPEEDKLYDKVIKNMTDSCWAAVSIWPRRGKIPIQFQQQLEEGKTRSQLHCEKIVSSENGLGLMNCRNIITKVGEENTDTENEAIGDARLPSQNSQIQMSFSPFIYIYVNSFFGTFCWNFLQLWWHSQ